MTCSKSKGEKFPNQNKEVSYFLIQVESELGQVPGGM
jgi:hypothetical protein